MKATRRVRWLLCLGCALCQESGLVLADGPRADAPVASSVPVKSPGDAFIIGGSKTALSSGGGGATGEIDLLHVASDNLKLLAGAHFNSVVDAHWAYGSIGAALTARALSPRPVTLSGDLQLGSGDSAARSFRYSVAAVGVGRAVRSKFWIQLEDRQYDIDTTHGNVAKVELTLLGSPQWFGSVSYAGSLGGNLETQLVVARFNYKPGATGYFAGLATGQASTAVADPQLTVVVQHGDLRQAFAGVALPLRDTQLLLVADYLKLGDFGRFTFGATLTMPLGRKPR